MAIPKALSRLEFCQATESDSLLQRVISHIRLGKEMSHPDLSTFKQVYTELSVTGDGLLMKQKKLVVPFSLRFRVIQLAHEGHQGLVKTRKLLCLWFEGLYAETEQFIKSCDCQAVSQKTIRAPLIIRPLPEDVWISLIMDYKGPLRQGGYFISLICLYSRFPIVIHIASTTAKLLVNFLDRVFADKGVPKRIASDNGPPFQSHELAEYMSAMGIEHTHSTPDWPEASGLVESFNKGLSKIVKVSSFSRPWEPMLIDFLRAYRSTPHTTSGVAPATLMYGREMRTKLPKIDESLEPVDMIKLKSLVQSNESEKKATMKANADSHNHAKVRVFMKDDYVRIQQLQTNKSMPKYELEPYVILFVNGKSITAKRLVDGKIKTRNISYFIPFHG